MSIQTQGDRYECPDCDDDAGFYRAVIVGIVALAASMCWFEYIQYLDAKSQRESEQVKAGVVSNG